MLRLPHDAFVNGLWYLAVLFAFELAALVLHRHLLRKYIPIDLVALAREAFANPSAYRLVLASSWALLLSLYLLLLLG